MKKANIKLKTNYKNKLKTPRFPHKKMLLNCAIKLYNSLLLYLFPRCHNMGKPARYEIKSRPRAVYLSKLEDLSSNGDFNCTPFHQHTQYAPAKSTRTNARPPKDCANNSYKYNFEYSIDKIKSISNYIKSTIEYTNCSSLILGKLTQLTQHTSASDNVEHRMKLSYASELLASSSESILKDGNNNSQITASNHLVRHSLSLYAASSLILVLCYLTTPLVALDTHPM